MQVHFWYVNILGLIMLRANLVMSCRETKNNFHLILLHLCYFAPVLLATFNTKSKFKKIPVTKGKNSRFLLTLIYCSSVTSDSHGRWEHAVPRLRLFHLTNLANQKVRGCEEAGVKSQLCFPKGHKCKKAGGSILIVFCFFSRHLWTD